MAKIDHIELLGTIIQALPAGKYRVSVNLENQEECLYTLDIPMSGSMKHNRGSGKFINLIEGDQVKVHVTPYDMKNGFIVGRVKTDQDINFYKNKKDRK